jgi:hypothetical protein
MLACTLCLCAVSWGTDIQDQWHDNCDEHRSPVLQGERGCAAISVVAGWTCKGKTEFLHYADDGSYMESRMWL